MTFNRFGAESLLRLLGVVATFALGVVLYLVYGYLWSTFLCMGIAAIQLYELIRFHQVIAIELDRFMAEMKVGAQGTSGQQFLLRKYFPQLEASLAAINSQIREREIRRIVEIQYLEAVVNFVPVPILIADEQGEVIYTSQRFRRLFAPAQLHHLSELASLIDPALNTCEPGDRNEIQLNVEDKPRRYLVDRNDITVRGSLRQAYVFLDIDQELEEGEQEAWNKLIRVLTHEMMNSLTPITSLSEAAHQRASKTDNIDSETLEALQTVSRRSRSLMDFVRGYHQLLKLPKPQKQPFQVNELLDSVSTLFRTDSSVTLKTESTVAAAYGDAALIEQALINLVRNAFDALADSSGAQVLVSANLNRESRLVIEVSDNGPGMEAEILENAVVPFYTSKASGSGIGLSLARQIAIAHEGNLNIDSQVGVGTKITMVI